MFDTLSSYIGLAGTENYWAILALVALATGIGLFVWLFSTGDAGKRTWSESWYAALDIRQSRP